MARGTRALPLRCLGAGAHPCPSAPGPRASLQAVHTGDRKSRLRRSLCQFVPVLPCPGHGSTCDLAGSALLGRALPSVLRSAPPTSVGGASTPAAPTLLASTDREAPHEPRRRPRPS